MAFAHPEKNLQRLGLFLGMKVADVGAGSGLYALAAAKQVGDSGKVYAIDVQQELLNKLKAESKRQRIHNIEVIWADAEKKQGTTLRDASIDAVIISNILFQIPDKRGLLKEATRILKPHGKLLVIDWADSFGGLGPQSKDIVRKEEVKELGQEEGLSFIEGFDAGDHHYGLIFTK